LPLECRRHLLVAFVRHDAGLLPDRQFASQSMTHASGDWPIISC
jgi:hypothetical protein